uniref:BPTI/Kunitz inhibitor domain-containing protein n=1 Tax=Oncorhynchus mykiss TaxID=8022 RepID=A0A8K9WTX4_ONCMY
EDYIPNSTYLTPDPCLLPMSEGGCWEHVLLWYYHPHSGECRPFVYGGCEGNHNRFNTKQECQRCPNGPIKEILYSIGITTEDLGSRGEVGNR